MAVIQIPLSKIGGDRAAFEQAVATHISNMKAFATTKGKPRPVVHPIVEMAVQRVTHPVASKKPDDYIPNYVIVDDTPKMPTVPSLSLDDRKNQLTAAVQVAEREAVNKLLPLRKRRLWQANVSNALLKKEEDRTVEDNVLIAENKALVDAFAALNLKAGQAESDIEDLTDDTIDSWQQPDFG